LISHLSVTQKGLILILVPLAFEILFVAVLGGWLREGVHDIAKLDRENDALGMLHQMTLKAGEIALYLADRNTPMTRLERRRLVDKGLQLLPDDEPWAGISASEHPELAPLTVDGTAVRDRCIALLKSMRADLSMPQSHPIQPTDPMVVMDIVLSVKNLSERTLEIESQVHAAEPAELARIRTGITAFLVIGVVLSCLISLGLARLFTDDVIKRLMQISKNATLIPVGQPLLPEQQGRDELVELDRVLHQTSVRLRELRLREFAILDNATEIICSVDSRLRFISANPATAKLWQYQSDELLGMSVLHLVAEHTAEATRAAFKRATETGEQTEFENGMRRGDGSHVDSRWRINWSQTDSAYYCVIHDVSDLRAIEKLKQEFLAMVSHDLRSPLSSVGVSLALLLDGKRGPLSERVQRLLKNAQSSSLKLTNLVNELLELEKLESSAFVLELTAVSASDACASAKESIEMLAKQAQVTLCGPAGDALILADPRRIVQVLINLLSNAIKFSPPASTVTISLARNEPEHVDIRITDEGPGIPLEHQALIFDKFQQSRAVSNVPVKSTGLGLAIVKAIVEAHYGAVGVESDGMHGSTFWIRLPLHQEDGS
jgi:PAS domain S-box-containing protein